MFRRHRAGPPPPSSQQQQRRHRPQSTMEADDNDDDDDDDDEDDVFSALSRRSNNKKAKTSAVPPPQTTAAVGVAVAAQLTQPPPPQEEQVESGKHASFTSSAFSSALMGTTTSSMKRHHKELSQGRKAKMDAVLQELQTEQQQEKDPPRHHHHKKIKSSVAKLLSSSSSSSSSLAAVVSQLPPLRKGGSHVEPGEEHLTTNIFVGNLAPNLTEEALQQLFGQFGELYSVKIMWPRTAEERARQRLTGFVCFYHRQDAEEAMEACNEADPFRNGRRLMLRWGKSVLKDKNKPPLAVPVVVPPPSLSTVHEPRRRYNMEDYTPDAAASKYESATNSIDHTTTSGPEKLKHKIQVVVPADPRRADVISLVASFVAKDGADLEQRLLHEPTHSLSFLTPNSESMEEHVFFKWRVYAYAQGDGRYTWRTDPFVMVKHGCVWIPPPVDKEIAARQEEEERRQQEELNRQRRRPLKRTEVKQRHQTQRPLTQEELDEFHYLTREQLCASREAIAQAMAFCFEKCSHSAPEIAKLLKDLLLLRPESGGGVEPRIARLYLLSDVLFNSQQPGVRSAFYYRDAIQQMAPEVFYSLGLTSNSGGRLTHNKMAKAVSSVLAAWTNWSVYSHTFLDELQARFEGKEIAAEKVPVEEEDNKTGGSSLPSDEEAARNMEEEDVAAQVASTVPRGDWKEVDHNDHQLEEATAIKAKNEADKSNEEEFTPGQLPGEDGSADGEPLAGEDNNVSGLPLEEDVDGEPLQKVPDEDGSADGEPFVVEDSNVDGLPLEEDVDGEPLQDCLDETYATYGLNRNVSSSTAEAPSKAPATGRELVGAHGKPANMSAPSSSQGRIVFADEDVDGEPLANDEDVDGEPLGEVDNDDADGEPR
ncbi:hypothetical protein ACA910_008336 [Epithemia clementina (nom. ined.)]